MLSSISENNFEEMFYHCMLIYRMELAELSKKDARIRFDCNMFLTIIKIECSSYTNEQNKTNITEN